MSYCGHECSARLLPPPPDTCPSILAPDEVELPRLNGGKHGRCAAHLLCCWRLQHSGLYIDDSAARKSMCYVVTALVLAHFPVFQACFRKDMKKNKRPGCRRTFSPDSVMRGIEEEGKYVSGMCDAEATHLISTARMNEQFDWIPAP
jgi:hypothetical protein